VKHHGATTRNSNIDELLRGARTGSRFEERTAASSTANPIG
jgi:hypothetical protein